MAKVIGLTGGIASGKSTVTAFLREQGYPVIDADAVVHELQAKGGKLYQVLLAEFGEAILSADGSLDRAKLGQAVLRIAICGLVYLSCRTRLSGMNCWQEGMLLSRLRM